MTRARRKSQRKIPKPAARALVAVPAKAAPAPDVVRANVRQAVEDAGTLPSPSIAQATAHEVDPARYTSRERTQAAMALDFNGTTRDSLTFVESTGFPGFPTLSLLGQLAEYRTMHETLADECVRMWGKVTSAGDTDPAKLADIEAELRRIDLRALVRQAVVHDQAFGGAHVYFKLKGDEKFRRHAAGDEAVHGAQGCVRGPARRRALLGHADNYNSIDPTAADFYKPSSWWMIGILVHATRLQTIISRPVADMAQARVFVPWRVDDPASRPLRGQLAAHAPERQRHRQAVQRVRHCDRLAAELGARRGGDVAGARPADQRLPR